MKEDNIIRIGLTIFIIFFVIVMFAGAALRYYDLSKSNKFCSDNYRSAMKDDGIYANDWADDKARLEEGYIKCCRNYISEHEIKKECQIMRR